MIHPLPEIFFPIDTGRKLNIHKTFRKRPGQNTCYRDLNINFDNLKQGDTHSHLSYLCDTFLRSNLANGVTCVKLQNSTSIDVMLTNMK